METLVYWLRLLIDIYQGNLKIDNLVKETDEMTKKERETFIDVVKGMTAEELELMIDIIPVELCLRRIEKELGKAKNMRETIKNMSCLIE